MKVLVILGFFIVLASSHDITLLEVPPYGDPRQSVELVCHYVRAQGDPDLHSVKWYRDNTEIFRYTPGQVPQTRAFNTTSIMNAFCDVSKCAINVTLPKRFNTRTSYTCEVSTEGPRFAVVKDTKSIVVAVILKSDPTITGLPGVVLPGDELLLNCSTAASMPPANIVWFIDGVPQKVESWHDKTEVSAADDFGLRSSWRALRFRVPTEKSSMSLRCEATQPTKPPYRRSVNETVLMTTSPYLSMFTGNDCPPSAHKNIVTLASIIFGFAAKYLWTPSIAP